MHSKHYSEQSIEIEIIFFKLIFKNNFNSTFAGIIKRIQILARFTLTIGWGLTFILTNNAAYLIRAL
jgi:hypothetical protein